MGTVFHPQQVAPKDPTHSRMLPSLDHHPSRANFTFLRKIASSGAQEEAVWWLAHDNLDPSQTYFVRQTSKVKYPLPYKEYTTTKGWRQFWKRCDY